MKGWGSVSGRGGSRGMSILRVKNADTPPMSSSGLVASSGGMTDVNIGGGDGASAGAIPWTKFQDWALSDNIMDYVVPNTSPPVILYRSLISSVPELTGYETSVIQSHLRDIKEMPQFAALSDGGSGALPFLDNIEVSADDTLTGDVYSLPGVTDGTRIRTARLSNLSLTLPSHYAVSVDSKLFYELGTLSSASASLEVPKLSALPSLDQSMLTSANEIPLNSIVALSAAVISSSFLFNLLSHHLTLNVFWV